MLKPALNMEDERMDEKLRIFADLYARYNSADLDWLEEGGDIEGPWQQAMDGLLGYAASEHGIGAVAIINASKNVEL